MAFLTLLTKEMRIRLRSEYLFWIIITYLFSLGLLSWLWLSNDSNYITPGRNGLGTIGLHLYSLLVQIQFFLLIVITPIFTVHAINGEKECQTFELLLCSHLSTLSLLSGKLLAGLTSTCILIIASIPLFSLIFFFEGVTPFQIAKASLIYLLTMLFISTLSLCCSTLFQRRAISTLVTYFILFVWFFFPSIFQYICLSTHNTHVLRHNPISYISYLAAIR